MGVQGSKPPEVTTHPSTSVPVHSLASGKRPHYEPWYFEDVTTTSQEPRRRMEHIPLTTSSANSQSVICVNTPDNVALFMEKFESDVRLLLPYCYNGSAPESSIALCFVSRLTMQDRTASQRPDCKFFPPFQASQRAFYFRLIPIGEPHDRLFIVEYYNTPEYRQATWVFDTHCWIQFEALLRLFFQQGYRYLMKLFPEDISLSCSEHVTAATCSSSAYAHSMSIPTPPPSASHTW